jgi:hypothetical protein
MDSSTASGMSPETVAKRIVKAIALQEKEVTVSGAPPRIASWLRSNFPSLYFYVMQLRARGTQVEYPSDSTFTGKEDYDGEKKGLVGVSRETIGKLLGTSD